MGVSVDKANVDAAQKAITYAHYDQLVLRHSKDKVQEVREEPTYSSNIGDQDVEVKTIPPPVPKPGPAGLDTTGKEFIAAVHSTGQFATYNVIPEKMSLKASEITGVKVVGDSMLAKEQTMY
ncbi:hypothetical protein DPMN_139659 [Dreissena polymorpha]|uniref:Uncharacterized protein n=1 Tax=Dreissena polymorpha TaxID=45954 RepID=A0A9D4JKZ8_DREPO|nr:hypothetical protein DPMN_139659 [Dreissena polymorpha]